MKLAIIGARLFDDYELLKREVTSRFNVSEITQIVSGGARGADMLAERFGLEYGIDMEIFPAQWGKYCKRAGYIRNTQIAEYADCAIAFPIGVSKGTYDTVRKMEELSKPVIIIKSRITPENITTLAPNEVTVQYGVTGRGYEPSLEGQICKVWIAPQGDTIYGLGILRFIKFAIYHSELTFYVTPIEGYQPNKVAVWFRKAVGISNIHLPQSYWDGIEYAYKHFHFK